MTPNERLDNEVLALLRCNHWLTRADIMDAIETGARETSRALQRLRRRGLVRLGGISRGWMLAPAAVVPVACRHCWSEPLDGVVECLFCFAHERRTP